jgi:hypothetical protein
MFNQQSGGAQQIAQDDAAKAGNPKKLDRMGDLIGAELYIQGVSSLIQGRHIL